MASTSGGDQVSASPASTLPDKESAPKTLAVANAWDRTAKLSEQQLTVLDDVSESCKVQAYPPHVVVGSSPLAQPHAQQHEESYIGSLDNAVLVSANQFYNWQAELQAACAQETEAKYKTYAEELRRYLSACDLMLDKVDNTLALSDALVSLHQDVSAASSSLSSSCKQLLGERDQLQGMAAALQHRLRLFNDFEALSAQVQNTDAMSGNDRLLDLFNKLDEGLAYFAAHPHYVEALAYGTKYRQLQARLMAMVRAKVQQVFALAKQQVQAAIDESSVGQMTIARTSSRMRSSKLPVLAEGSEVSILYVKFRAAAESNLRGLFKDMDSRAESGEYSRLMTECQSIYCQTRLHLLLPFVQQRIHAYKEQKLPQLLRNSCKHLIRVAQMERQLFEQIFPAFPLSSISAILEPLCSELYDTLRPHFVQLSDIDELCELIYVLRNEVQEELEGVKLQRDDFLGLVFQRLVADLQSRLIYRCQASIKEEVANYQPVPGDFILQFNAPAQQNIPSGGDETGWSGEKTEAAGSGVDAHRQSAESSDVNENGASRESSSADLKASQSYSHAYPPVEHTTLVLAKLYHAVEISTFAGLAQEAISACENNLQLAVKGVAKSGGVLDSQLFAIKHLLMLREQIASFNVELQATDMDLDFSHMRDHLRRIMTGDASLFSLSMSNGMVQMLGKGGPRVMQTHHNSKRQLERHLKAACEALIMALTKLTVDPLLIFITKVTAVRVADNAAPKENRKPLREQAFASAPRVAELVGKVNQALGTSLPAAVARMQAYLNNANTSAVLFKPVKANIAEAHAQIAKLLHASYTAEEVARISLMSHEELRTVLDALG